MHRHIHSHMTHTVYTYIYIHMYESTYVYLVTHFVCRFINIFYLCENLFSLYDQIIKRDRKSYIINISKGYSIVSQFTSFVAIEKREKVSSDDIAPHLCNNDAYMLMIY